MLNIPFATHWYLIQPLTNDEHIKIFLARRFLSFIERIKSSEKPPLVMLMSEAISYVRSTIELNIRNIMLFVGKNSVQSVEPSDAKNIKYFEIQAGDKWRVPLARKIIEVRANTLEVPGFDEEELETISDYFVQSSFGSIVLFFPFLSFRSFLWASSVLVLLLLLHNN